jgi:O-antigen/teichoic acid export membrane protein
LYGKDYLSSVEVLRWVVWYVTYSYIGQVRNIWILAEGKQKLLWRINLLGALLNVILNALMIPIWGIIGAAVASFITQFFTNFLLGFFMKSIKNCNLLMLKGMNPKFVFREFKKIISRV